MGLVDLVDLVDLILRLVDLVDLEFTPQLLKYYILVPNSLNVRIF